MHWLARARGKAKDLEDYVEDLEAQNKFMREELVKISCGITLTKHEEFQEFSTRIQLRAAEALNKICQMKHRICDKQVF